MAEEKTSVTTAVVNTDFSKATIDQRIIVRKIDDLVVKPKSVFVNKFTEESALQFHREVCAAEDTGQSIIPIYIDSYGGLVDAVLHMADVIKQCKTPVATVAIGKAMSCGSILLSLGSENNRYMSPNSRVMIHDVSNWTSGKIEEIKADAAETDRLQKLVFKMMAQNTGHEEDYYLKLIHEKSHADWFLTADECKKHNLVNHIRIPRFNISVSVDVKFS